MAEENNSTMNLDLNLGPVDNTSDDDSVLATGSYPNIAMNLEDWLDDGPVGLREVVRHRNHGWRSLWRQLPIPREQQSLALQLLDGNDPQTGEGSVPSQGRHTEAAKICENGTAYAEDEDMGENKEGGINNGNEGSFFDCNICLDLAKEPVVTCCGHLFCWPCLYRWLHHHSDAKECPVCKGEVTMKDVTPIYGRGNDKREPDMDSSLKIPLRPQARRIESWRQTIQRAAFTVPPMEEMIRRLGGTYDLNRELSAQVQARNSDGQLLSPERRTALLNRILTSSGMRREQVNMVPPAVVPHNDWSDSNDLSDSEGIFRTEPTPRVASDGVLGLPEPRHNRLLRPLSGRRLNPYRVPSLSNLTQSQNLAVERLVESYFHSNPVERNQEHDRDSVSSIAAVIHSESQTMDNAVEIDSRVSRSTSSSRRRNDTSRISDVDSGDSRAPRRRRLN